MDENNTTLILTVFMIFLMILQSLFKPEEIKNKLKKHTIYFFRFGLPIGLLIWINFDSRFEYSKSTMTLLMVIFGMLIYNFVSKLIFENNKFNIELEKSKHEEFYKLSETVLKSKDTEIKVVQEFQELLKDDIQIYKENLKNIEKAQDHLQNQITAINDRIFNYFISKDKKSDIK